MQTTTQPKAAPAPAQVPSPPVSITTVGPDGTSQTLTIPRTSAEVRELRVQRQELAEQLANVASRRRQLAVEIRAADDASRPGLQDRLRLLDQRILRLENDIDATGRQLSSTPAQLLASEGGNPPTGGDDWEEGMAFGGFFTLLGVVIVVAYRRFRKRRRRVAPEAQLPTESVQRLERLEHGMEAIAIEIERISEGQRFVTRLLSESQTPVGASHRIANAAAEREHLEADSVEGGRR